MVLSLIGDIDAKEVIADRRYDTNALRRRAVMCAPVYRTGKVDLNSTAVPGQYTGVEVSGRTGVLHGTATHYAKNTASFLAASNIRCVCPDGFLSLADILLHVFLGAFL
jgi:hypothetical protein